MTPAELLQAMIDHPELGEFMPTGLLLTTPGGPYRTQGNGAEGDETWAECLRRRRFLDLGDPVTAAWSPGYEVDAAAPYQRAAVLGYALARLSPVDDTAAYQLVDRGDGDADVHALDSGGATLATWRITGGGGGIPSSVAKQ